MGVDARIVVYAPSESVAESACRAAYKRIADLDSIMSDYRKNSELNRLSDAAGTKPMKISMDLMTVLVRSKEIGAQTGGLFDVTAAPVIKLWREARKSQKMPEPMEIKSALKLVGYRRLFLDPERGTALLEAPGMRLDLGGIAKGYACDEAQKVLKANGIRSALVEMGGDIAVSAPPPGSKGWVIRVPNAGTDLAPKDLEFSHCGVSSSGDTEQFVVIDGKQYSHVVNALTGIGLTNRVQATVIAPSAFLTDPLSTAITLVDEKVRTRLLKIYPKAKLYVRVVPQA